MINASDVTVASVVNDEDDVGRIMLMRIDRTLNGKYGEIEFQEIGEEVMDVMSEVKMRVKIF